MQQKKHSRYKGVTWSKVRKKWLARYTIGGKTLLLGHYDDEAQAAGAYNSAVAEHLDSLFNPVKNKPTVYVR